MIILHTYLKDYRNGFREEATWSFFDKNKVSLSNYDIRHVPVDDNYTYDNVMMDVWGIDDLITIEHDMEPSITNFNELITCNHPWCAQKYNFEKCRYEILPKNNDNTLYIECTGRILLPVYSHFLDATMMNVKCGKPDDNFADLLPLGLTKFSLSLQKRVKPNWAEGEWRNIDRRISLHIRRVHGIRGHLHNPFIGHRHNHQDCHQLKSDING